MEDVEKTNYSLADAMETEKPYAQKIYFLDNSYKTFMVPASANCETVVNMVAEKLGFQYAEEDSYWFSLYESKDGSQLSNCLAKDNVLKKVVDKWSDEANPTPSGKIVFQIKLFLDTLTKSPDPQLQYMRYIQAVYCINTGYYYADKDLCVTLAVYQFIFKFGYDKLKEYTLDDWTKFLSTRAIEYMPLIYHGETLASDIHQAAETVTESMTKEEGMQKYLEIVTDMKCYGCTFFAAQQFQFKTPTDILMGVHAKGFMLFDKNNNVPYHLYELNDCLRWGYVPTSTFYVSLKSNNAKNIIFGTNYAPEMCDAMTSYAYGWLRHGKITKERVLKATAVVEDMEKSLEEDNTPPADEPVSTEEVVVETAEPEKVEVDTEG